MSRKESSRQRKKTSVKALRQALCLAGLNNREVRRNDRNRVTGREKSGRGGRRGGGVRDQVGLSFSSPGKDKILECWNDTALMLK